MKTNPINRFHSAIRPLTVICVGCAGFSQAADKTWVDAVANNTWDTTATDTWTDSTAWDNAALDTAIFGGTGETVTLGVPITANSLTFDAGAYLLTGAALTLDGGAPTINANADTRIDCTLEGTDQNAFIRGAGTLTLGGVVTFTGGLAWEGLYRYVPTDSTGILEVVDGADFFAKNIILMQDHVSNCNIIYNQTGGMVEVSGQFGVGGSTAGGTSDCTNTANISGGTLNAGTAYLYKWAYSTLNVSNAGVVNAEIFRIGWVDSSPTGAINIGDGATFSGGTSIQDGGTSGILNVISWDIRNNRSYVLNFNGGTLQAGDTTASITLSNAFTSIEVHEAGGIIDNDDYDISYAQEFGHGGTEPIDGGLVFNGSGTTTLGANSYTGPTIINAGTLKLPNSLSTTAVTIHDEASLDCSGTIGDLTTGASVGNTATILGTVAAGSTPISAQALTLNGGDGSVVLDVNGAGLIDGVTYDVMSYTSIDAPGASSPLAAFTTSSQVFTPVLDTVNKKVQVVYSASGGLTWSGIGSSEWSYATGLDNWTSGGTAVDFAEGDFVTFGNVASTDVELDVEVTPGGVTFDNDASHDYSLTGAGGIVGSASFTKQGAGKLTFNTVNTYTGTTSIAAGTLQIGDDDFNGILSASTINNDGILFIYNETGDMDQGTELSSEPITGSGSLLKGGFSTLTLNAANTYSGGSTISGGTLRLDGGFVDGYCAGTGTITLGDSNTPVEGASLGVYGAAWTATGPDRWVANDITVAATGADSGPLMIYRPTGVYAATIKGNITLANDVIFSNTTGDRLAIEGQITGTGNVTIEGNRVNFDSDVNDYLGSTTIAEGGQLQLNGDYSIPYTSDVTVNGQLSFQSGAATLLDISSLSGSGTVNVPWSGGFPVLTIGADSHDGDFAGSIQSVISVIKTGGSTQIFGGENTYTGTTVVRAGTLQIDGVNSGGGAVTANSAATLAGIGSISGATTIEAGGFVAPGNATIGTITLADAILVGTYQCQLDTDTSDIAQVTGTLTVDPSAVISISTVAAPAASSYTIATYGSLAGSLPTVTGVPAGYAVDTSVAGEIRLVSTGAGNYNSWAAANGIAGEPSSADHDKDGLDNGLEYALGLDPTVPNGTPGSVDGNVLTYTKGTAAIANGDVTYVIETSHDLVIWTPVVTQTPPNDDETISYTLPTGLPKEFARLNTTIQ